MPRDPETTAQPRSKWRKVSQGRYSHALLGTIKHSRRGWHLYPPGMTRAAFVASTLRDAKENANGWK